MGYFIFVKLVCDPMVLLAINRGFEQLYLKNNWFVLSIFDFNFAK